MIETNQESGNETETVAEEEASNAITIPKEDYDRLNQTLGSLKREIKDLKGLKAEEKSSSKSEPKLDEKLMERLDKLALRAAGITEADEVELFNKWKGDTNRDSENIIENSTFRKELDELRTSRKNIQATSDIKGETGQSSAKEDPNYWVARATKDEKGKLLFPEEMPREMYSKVLELVVPSKKETKMKFYNS